MPCSSTGLPSRRVSGKYANVPSALFTANAKPSAPAFTPSSTLSICTVCSRLSRRVARTLICTRPSTSPSAPCSATPMYWRNSPDISSDSGSCTTESAPCSSFLNAND